MVFEPVDTVVERIVEYKRTCNQVLVSG